MAANRTAGAGTHLRSRAHPTFGQSAKEASKCGARISVDFLAEGTMVRLKLALLSGAVICVASALISLNACGGSSLSLIHI